MISSSETKGLARSTMEDPCLAEVVEADIPTRMVATNPV